MQRFDWLAAFFVVLCSVFGTGVQAQSITVFAASSLRDVMVDIAHTYEAETGIEVVLAFSASSTVARQVAQGAPADVVLLADMQWIDWLFAQGVLETAQVFASNRVVLVSADPLAITDAGDIVAALGDGNLAMAQVDAVPAGRYGRAALMELGLWEAVEPRVVQASNVRSALRLVERREAVLGIGYVSDLVALPDLYALFEFGKDAHVVAFYAGGHFTPQGADFMDYMMNDVAQGALNNWGFLPPADPR